MMGILALLKGNLGKLLGMFALVVGILGTAYARGRKDQHDKQKKVEQKKYEKAKDEFQKIEEENRDNTKEQNLKALEESYKRFKK